MVVWKDSYSDKAYKTSPEDNRSRKQKLQGNNRGEFPFRLTWRQVPLKKYVFITQKILNSEAECLVHQFSLFCVMKLLNKQIHEAFSILNPVECAELKWSFLLG